MAFVVSVIRSEALFHLGTSSLKGTSFTSSTSNNSTSLTGRKSFSVTRRHKVITTCTSEPEDGKTSDENQKQFNETLLQDAKKFRVKKKNNQQTSNDEQQQSGGKKSLASIIETILVWDFFVICLLLGWLGVAVIVHYGARNDSLLDPWLAIWPVVTQPLLGVLMLATISQGLTSYFSNKD